MDGYKPERPARTGHLIALEGVGGSGKTTLSAVLARRLDAAVFHTAPEPLLDLQPYVNRHAKALPHLAFYLAGALHVSDLARRCLTVRHVVVDRYLSSVIANHAAVRGATNDDAAAIIEPFRDYLLVPDLTVYLHASPAVLTARGWRRFAQTRRRPQGSDILTTAQEHFDQIAQTDPTALHIDTDDKSPGQIADLVLTELPSRAARVA